MGGAGVATNTRLSPVADARASIARIAPRSEDPVDIQVGRAMAMRRAGDVSGAEGLLGDILAGNPKSGLAVEELIHLYSMTGRVRDAEAMFDYACRAGMDGDRIHAAMVCAYASNGMDDMAVLAFDIAHGLGRTSETSCRAAFYCAVRSTDAASAEAVFRRSAAAGHADEGMLSSTVSLIARASGPEYSELLLGDYPQFACVHAYTTIIHGYGLRKDAANASRCAQEALDKGLADPKLVDDAMRLLERLGKPDLAWDICQKACMRGATDAAVHSTIMSICSKFQKPVRVRIAMDRAAGLGQDSTRMYVLGITSLASCGELHHAGRHLRAGCAKGMLDAESVSWIFSRLYGTARYPEILLLCGDLPFKIKDDPRIILKTADAMRKCKDFVRAMKVADQLLAIPDVAPEFAYRARAIKAYSQKDMGRGPDALKELLDVWREAPENPAYSPRVACGIVFCCQELGFPDSVPAGLLSELAASLETYKVGISRNMLHDISNALEILRSHSGSNAGAAAGAGPCKAGNP
jgi:hypothetical protein